MCRDDAEQSICIGLGEGLPSAEKHRQAPTILRMKSGQSLRSRLAPLTNHQFSDVAMPNERLGGVPAVLDHQCSSFRMGNEPSCFVALSSQDRGQPNCVLAGVFEDAKTFRIAPEGSTTRQASAILTIVRAIRVSP
jgi:hypothetical protein